MKFPSVSFAICAVVSLGSSALAANIRPVGADGKPLNLNFESGSLQDWTATGDAFAKQPIRGDLVAQRRKDMCSEHEGQFWLCLLYTSPSPRDS